jgi:hypothetical protein
MQLVCCERGTAATDLPRLHLRFQLAVRGVQIARRRGSAFRSPPAVSFCSNKQTAGITILNVESHGLTQKQCVLASLPGLHLNQWITLSTFKSPSCAFGHTLKFRPFH